MGLKPTPKHSIERRDNSGPYSPDNCYWATRHDQHRNMRSNHWVTIHGETRLLTDWIRLMNQSRSTVYQRLRAGWSEQEAIMRPSAALEKRLRLGSECAR